MSTNHREIIHLKSNDREIHFDIPKNGTIGCFMSGGADSSIMCYILAKTISDHGLQTKVYPITAEMTQRPYNLRCAWDVVKRTEELTNFKFSQHLCYILPNHSSPISDDGKVEVHNYHINFYAKHLVIDVIFNGLTANPPLAAIPEALNANRQQCRDDESWILKKENTKGLAVPFIRHDKRSIGELYQHYGVLGEIFPLTRSCEADLDESKYFRETCYSFRDPGKECWWCKERLYGFGEFPEAKDFI